MMAAQKYPTRKSIRLPEYDYSLPGAYFVTINCYGKQPLFGKAIGEEALLNQFGHLAEQHWQSIPDHFPLVSLDAYIVMQNHVHGILVINEYSTGSPVRAHHAAPIRTGMPKVASGSLSAIIRSYKSAVTRSINRMRSSPGTPVWHRNYFERANNTMYGLSAGVWTRDVGKAHRYAHQVQARIAPFLSFRRRALSAAFSGAARRGIPMAIVSKTTHLLEGLT